MDQQAQPPSGLVGERVIRCPGCGGPSLYASSNASRPFCSERCRGVDLGAWATEGYRVATDEAADLPADAEASSPDPD